MTSPDNAPETIPGYPYCDELTLAECYAGFATLAEQTQPYALIPGADRIRHREEELLERFTLWHSSEQRSALAKLLKPQYLEGIMRFINANTLDIIDLFREDSWSDLANPTGAKAHMMSMLGLDAAAKFIMLSAGYYYSWELFTAWVVANRIPLVRLENHMQALYGYWNIRKQWTAEARDDYPEQYKQHLKDFFAKVYIPFLGHLAAHTIECDTPNGIEPARSGILYHDLSSTAPSD